MNQIVMHFVSKSLYMKFKISLNDKVKKSLSVAQREMMNFVGW